MSTFDDASLVFIPSGYKTSKAYSVKPIDGTGDLTFSRSNDTATRVASNGLIERVRTNLVLQSQTFDNASWIKSNITATANSTNAPDGTATADTILASTTSVNAIYQAISTSGVLTLSVYAKANTSNFIYLDLFDASPATDYVAIFNLSNGTYVGNGGFSSVDSYNIQSVGNGWYRLSATKDLGASGNHNFIYGVSNGSGITATAGTSIFVWGAQIETGDIATDYIATTSAAVSVGPVANVPRLDYLNSSCPKLNLEPQRTNNAQFSEAFDNAWWTKTNVTLTSTLGGPIDQSKYFTITCDGTTGTFKGVGKSFLNASANTYSLSVFAKAGTSSTFVISSRATLTTNDVFASFNLANGTIISQNGGTASIVNYGSGWYRCTFVVVNAGTFTNQASIFFGHPHGAANGATVLATGAMSEIGAYATSYIPTLGAAVTRGADACSKTGISSLIGQTEGTLFADFVVNALNNASNILNSERNTNASFFLSLLTNGKIDAGLYASGSPAARITQGSVSVGQRAKVAYAYKSGSCALYINGTQVGTSSGTFTLPSTLDDLFLNDPTTYFAYQENVSFNQALLFKTRLTNAQLAELTTI